MLIFFVCIIIFFRQIAADCLVVISKLQERNPEIQIRNTLLDLISIIRDAIQR